MNVRKNTTLVAASVALALTTSPGLGEDIDIYATDGGIANNPNVLVIIDNSANWAASNQHWDDNLKQGESELNALRLVSGELGSDINLGLMLFTEGDSANNPNGPGGYVRFAIRPMNATNKAALAELIGNPSGCTEGHNSVNGTPNCIYQNFVSTREKVGTAKTDYSAAMFETFKYFGGYTSPDHVDDGVAGTPQDASHFGQTRYAGAPDEKTDSKYWMDVYDSDGDGNTTEFFENDTHAHNWDSYGPYVDWKPRQEQKWVSPIDDGECGKNYIIFIGNGFPTQDSPASLLEGVGGDASQLEMPDFTTDVGATVEDLVNTTACGTYTSVAECEAAAAVTYAESGYESFRCEAATTCSSGEVVTTTDNLGNSACGLYSDDASCRAALASLYPDYDSFSCSLVDSNCSYTHPLTPPVEVANSTCVPETSSSTACSTWVNDDALNSSSEFYGYADLTCVEDTAVTHVAGCHPIKDAIWQVMAGSQVLSGGSTFYMQGSTTQTATSDSTSYRVYGTRTVTEVTPTGTTSLPADNKINHADEWARFLNRTDVSSVAGQQNVITYTIDVFKDAQDEDQTRLLLSTARAGGGKYFAASNEEEIKNALRKIMSEIQAVNSVFASSSLPVSVNTQGTYLNQVFIGMFRPDAGGLPRWPGNLKQYKFAFFADQMNLADKNGEEAISSTTGFVSPCSTSFWTTDSGTYWDYPGSDARSTCSATANSPYSDAPDGDIVEKGAAAQRHRDISDNYSSRVLKTCDGSSATSCTSLTDFATTNTAILSGHADRANLIDWVRGKDVDDEDTDGVTAEVRPSVHGGVIHSQPAVIDFGDDGVYAFYGADDGIFHAVDGGTTDAEGSEAWGFIAPETVSKLQRLRDNEPLISFPTTSMTITPTPMPKDYFFDGSIGVYQNGTADVWIYPTMRRGGRAIYAFDVTDPDDPALMWRKGCFTNDTTNDSNCSSGWSAIGQTWSKPEVASIQGYPKPVLVFGGGYDTCEDDDSQSRCTATPRKGANVWFVDAETGEIITVYNTRYSVAGDIALLKNASGNVTYAYAVDTGGYVYRIKVGSYDGTTFTNWSTNATTDITLAYLSEDGQERKFLYGADVVAYKDYNMVLAGTGDREHPLVDNYACNNGSGSVVNGFYGIRDYVDLAGYPASLDDGTGTHLPYVVPTDLLDVTSMANATETGITNADLKGWRFEFTHACEQTVNKPLTFAGTVYFGTNQPQNAETLNACEINLGTARGYAIDFLTGNPIGDSRYVEYLGGGLPPSPVAGVVEVDGTKQPFIIGGSTPGDPSPSPLQGTDVSINPPSQRTPAFWYKEVD